MATRETQHLPPPHLEPPGTPGPQRGFEWPAERRPVPGPPAPVERPSLAALIKRWARAGAILGGIALAGAIYLAPLPAGLSVEGKTAFAILALCVSLWITSALPFGVTGLLGVALLGFSGAMKPAEAFAAFGSSAVFFLIGIFLIAAALIETGLSKRCALLFLRRFEGSPYKFAMGMMLAGVFGTVWMPNQATAAMLFPIAVEVALALRLRPKESNYAKVLFFALAWGAMIGSNASFLGSTRAALALGMLQKSYGTSISFLDWVLAAAPVVLLGVVTTPLILLTAYPRERIDFGAARTVLEDAVRELGPMRRRQLYALGILILTVAAWVLLGGRRVDLAVIALLGAVALFATGVLKWESAERHIYWNIVLMYGGAIAIGVLIDRSGAARWLLAATVGDVSISPYVAIVGTGLAALLLSEIMSNAAAVAAVLPLGFSLGAQVGANPAAIVLATSLGAGLDFLFPISTAPNTMIYASGYLRTSDFVRVGAIMTVVQIAIILLVVKLWWPLLGLL